MNLLFRTGKRLPLAVVTLLLLVYPVVAQAGARDWFDRNASFLARLCDGFFAALGYNPSNPTFGAQIRANIKPFIEASHLLKIYKLVDLNSSPLLTSFDFSVGSGLVEQGDWVHGIALFDANGNGLTDIYITHDNRPPVMSNSSLQGLELGNKLYINLGNGPDGLPAFVEVAAISGVQELGRKSRGVAIADYDNDGRLDMYVTNGVDGLITNDPQRMPPGYQRLYGAYNPGEGRNTLFHNDGNINYTLPEGMFPWRTNRVVQVPVFSDKTDFAGVGGGSYESISATWGDIDNDGYVDLFVTNIIDMDFYPTRYIGLPVLAYFGEKNTLFHNKGDGTFTDITDRAGVGGKAFPLTYPLLINASGRDRPIITDSLGRPVNPEGALSHHAMWYDYDGDGYVDLFVANDLNPIEVYHNNQDLTFTEVTQYTSLKLQGAWMEIGLWDYDGDGRMDIFATNLGSGAFNLNSYVNGSVAFTSSLGLFGNDGIESVSIDGREVPVPKFTWMSDKVMVDWSRTLPPVGLTVAPACHPTSDLSKPRGLERGEFGWGAIFPDVNNDGWPDLYWVGGLGRCDPNFKIYCINSPGRLLLNGGNGAFTDISVEARVLDLVGVNYETKDRMNLLLGEVGSGLSMGDLKNNGYPDIIVSNHADYTPFGHDPPGSPRSGEIVSVPTFLFINPGGDNNWLKVHLVGTNSNRAGIGAQIRVTLQDGRVLTKYLLSGDVTGGQTQLDQMFGVGRSARVDRVEVKWPSGNKDVLQDVETNQMIKIVEGTHPLSQEPAPEAHQVIPGAPASTELIIAEEFEEFPGKEST